MITLKNLTICYNFKEFTFNTKSLDKFFEELHFRFYS